MVPRGQWDLPLRELRGQSGRAVGTGALTLRAGPLVVFSREQPCGDSGTGVVLPCGPGCGGEPGRRRRCASRRVLQVEPAEHAGGVESRPSRED